MRQVQKKANNIKEIKYLLKHPKGMLIILLVNQGSTAVIGDELKYLIQITNHIKNDSYYKRIKFY